MACADWPRGGGTSPERQGAQGTLVEARVGGDGQAPGLRRSHVGCWGDFCWWRVLHRTQPASGACAPLKKRAPPTLTSIPPQHTQQDKPMQRSCYMCTYQITALLTTGAARTALSTHTRVHGLVAHLIPQRSNAQTHLLAAVPTNSPPLRGGKRPPHPHSRKSESLFLVVWVAQVSPPRFRK